MCLRPVNIVNRSKCFDELHAHPLNVSVPCGQCAECQHAKSEEYLLRSYYQARECIDNGGFVLFDTLTYRDSDLPHLSDDFEMFKDTLLDYPCFSRKHVTDFFKRLRINLTRSGFDVKANLKYFVTSEYGTDERFTHRPHYHILFYVLDPSLDPLVLSRYISDAWPYGRTDGIPFQSPSYVLTKHTYGKGYNCDSVHLENTCYYVSKYVQKNSSFEAVINARVEAAYQLITEQKVNLNIKGAPTQVVTISYADPDAKYELLRQIRRRCCPFHRQSVGFGLSALVYNNVDDVFQNGYLIFPSSKDIVHRVSLPTYFARKLFYDLVEDFRGLPCWKLNDYGIKYKLTHLQKGIDNLADRLHTWYLNLPVTAPYAIPQIDSLLDGRSWFDFARYLLVYKGRTAPSVKDFRSLDFSEWVARMYHLDPEKYQVKWRYNYTTKDERNTLFDGYQKIVNRWLGDAKTGYDLPPEQDFMRSEWHNVTRTDILGDIYVMSWRHDYYVHSKGYQATDLRTYQNMRVIHDRWSIEFHDFDTLYNIYVSTQKYVNLQKQSAYDLKQIQTERWKALKQGHTPLNYRDLINAPTVVRKSLVTQI